MLKRLGYTIAALVVAANFFAGSVRINAAPIITEYPLPAPLQEPYDIITGPDGAMWFAALNGYIGRVTTSGAFTEYPIPTPLSCPYGISNGPDGAMWFVELCGNKIGRITTSGAITEYPIPTFHADAYFITPGPDGAMWFTEATANKIGRITTSGTITEYAVPTPNSYPFDIITGPDGAMWFTESFGNNVGRITTSGDITEYPTTGGYLYGITNGPDGAMWFTDGHNTQVGRITASGAITYYYAPTGYKIITGPDGALWFSAIPSGNLVRLTTSGALTQYPVPTPYQNTWGITNGPDGALWFTELSSSKIGRIDVSSVDDTAPPLLGTFNWGNTNPKPLTASATLVVPATDAASGLDRAEYFIGPTDPGEGNGTAMTLANQQTDPSGVVTAADLTATFGTTLATGSYDITVRAQDKAGNWSVTNTGTLVVFDATGPTDFTVGKQVVPVFNTDVLPGLVNSNQKDKADLSFDALFTATGTVDPASWLTLNYSTGNGCDPVKHPEKCDSILTFAATTISPNSITLLTITGQNNSIGSFQGTGTLTLNGATTHNPFRVTGTDGSRTLPASNDDVTLYIYAPNTNPATATPLYHLHIAASGNWLKIN